MDKKKKILIWGTGYNYNIYISRLQYFESKGEIEIVGVTSNDHLLKRVDGYPYISKKEVPSIEFDYIVLCVETKNRDEAEEEVKSMKVPLSKIIRSYLLDRPGFTFLKYFSLKESNLSIVSSSCWGRSTYARYRLEFLSPFINIGICDKDYLGIMKNFRKNVQADLVFCGEEYNEIQGYKYPVYSLNGYKLHMVHYPNYKVAEDKWKERVKRINYDNMLLMLWTDNVDIAKQFNELPYQKKICFVPFLTDIPSAFTLTSYANKYPNNHPFPLLVNDTANGNLPYYDEWELLLNGKIKMRYEI